MPFQGNNTNGISWLHLFLLTLKEFLVLFILERQRSPPIGDLNKYRPASSQLHELQRANGGEGWAWRQISHNPRPELKLAHEYLNWLTGFSINRVVKVLFRHPTNPSIPARRRDFAAVFFFVGAERDTTSGCIVLWKFQRECFSFLSYYREVWQKIMNTVFLTFS